MQGDPPNHVHLWASPGLRLLRAFHEGALAFGDRRTPVRFVLDAATGDPVFPTEPAVAPLAGDLDAAVVLSLPDEASCRLEVLAHPRLIERSETREPCDRWCAYFGTPPAGIWLSLRIDSAKAAGPLASREAPEVYSAETLALPNPLTGPIEWRLIKQLNADLTSLAAACAARSGVTAGDPRAVGIDPAGIDVRARFGIIRLEFSAALAPALDATAAQRALDDLLAAQPEPPRA